MCVIAGHELIQYTPGQDDITSLLDLTDDTDLLAEHELMGGSGVDFLHTPSLEVTSPLARRRLSKNHTTVSTDDID